MKQISITLATGNNEFRVHKSQFVHIKPSGDCYFMWKNDWPRLQTMDWSADGTFRICRNSPFKQIYIIRQQF